MDNYLKIFEKNLNDLIKISINHRKNDGQGVLFCNFTNKEKMDVYYLSLFESGERNNKFPEKYFNYYLEKYQKMETSFIYFNLYDDKQDINIELDLDKRNVNKYENIVKQNEQNEQNQQS